MSGEPGSADWRRSSSVATLSEGLPCLNVDCAFMDARRRGALVKEGNFVLMIAGGRC